MPVATESLPEPKQTALVPDAEFYLPCPSSSPKKRYTARQLRAIESKRELVVMALASGWPPTVIAKRAGLNERTVCALAAAESQKVAGSRKEFAQCLHTLGARWFGLARTKEDEASFLQLVMAAGIATQRGSELLLTGEGVEEEKSVQETHGAEVRDRVANWLKERISVDGISTDNNTQLNSVKTLKQCKSDNHHEIERIQEGGGGGLEGGRSTILPTGEIERGIIGNGLTGEAPAPAGGTSEGEA